MSDSHNLIELISESDISARVKKMGLEISSFYKNDSAVFVVVLNGAIIFAADLIRTVNIECKLDQIIELDADHDLILGEVVFLLSLIHI